MKSLKLLSLELFSFLIFLSFRKISCSIIEVDSFDKEIGAWHFHTYFFEVDKRQVNEMLNFRKALREKIDDGIFPECSLNQIYVGWDGPHPISQFEMCCNKSSFAVAHSYHTQNHGNLTVLIHPLTVYDAEDHRSRASWLGKSVMLYDQCPCLYKRLKKPRPCPVYPDYPDELPTKDAVYFVPIAGTEDYKGLNKGFNILTDSY